MRIFSTRYQDTSEISSKVDSKYARTAMTIKKQAAQARSFPQQIIQGPMFPKFAFSHAMQ
jgi:hypothetical protein